MKHLIEQEDEDTKGKIYETSSVTFLDALAKHYRKRLAVPFRGKKLILNQSITKKSLYWGFLLKSVE